MNFAQILENNKNYENKKVYLQEADINEEIILNDNLLNIKYKGFSYYVNKVSTQQNTKIQIPSNLSSLQEIYNIANISTEYNFKNYPNNGIIQVNHTLYVFDDNNKYEILLPCSDYYISDTLINKITGVKISFENTENIIAKNGNWGIINKRNEIKTPFIYDLIYPLNNNPKERFYCEGDSINCKKTIEYNNSINNDRNLFLAKKGYGWGIIDENNNIIIPFDYKKIPDNDELTQIKSQINKKIQTDYDKNERESIKHSIPYFILDMILLPVWILMPYPFSGHINIDYR